jgi:ubiquitin-protein ligase
MISAPGIAPGETGGVRVRRLHRCTIYLHADYPRRPPVITWETPIVHPNILSPSRNGGVCLGSWSASESLADVVQRLIDMVSFRSFNPADALDKEAAAWVLEHRVKPGVDVEALVARATADPEVVIRTARSRAP